MHRLDFLVLSTALDQQLDSGGVCDVFLSILSLRRTGDSVYTKALQLQPTAILPTNFVFPIYPVDITDTIRARIRNPVQSK
jgi:hypothetical protein